MSEWMTLAWNASLAALRDHVLNVLEFCPKEKMSGPNAGRPVAAMKNADADRDGSVL
jgi:hypothetical protein